MESLRLCSQWDHTFVDLVYQWEVDSYTDKQLTNTVITFVMNVIVRGVYPSTSHDLHKTIDKQCTCICLNVASTLLLDDIIICVQIQYIFPTSVHVAEFYWCISVSLRLFYHYFRSQCPRRGARICKSHGTTANRARGKQFSIWTIMWIMWLCSVHTTTWTQRWG